ncbi:MAG: hypothetical protein K0Q43_4045 [Ramlibacter sp.]|jgi:DNA-binding winged helix-turn-helix (wHTH) protein|nr:hypothetical protein [Ramlibacter sp.]
MAANRLPLGDFVLDLAAGELFTARGQLAGLRKQALDVLLALGRRPGQVVSKDDLIQLVWPNVVVSEGSLTQAIADIRRVLGDGEHLVVRNVARRGYMLVPDDLAPTPDEPLPTAAPSDPSATTGLLGRFRLRRAALLSAVALAVLLAAGGWLAWRGTGPSWQSPADLARTPLPRELPPLSIIVLPLAVEGEVADAEWLADALHGDIVIAIAQMHDSLVELARDWSQTAANTNSALRWPPIHAAALLRLGQRDAAQQAFDEYMRRHPGFVAGQVKVRLPSEDPTYAEMRSRLIASLHELGMR